VVSTSHSKEEDHCLLIPSCTKTKNLTKMDETLTLRPWKFLKAWKFL